MAGKRGRPSSAALAMLVHHDAIETIPRPQVPHDLNDEETEVWASIVNRMPADWFTTETLPLLSQYCRHTIQARRIAELIERATGDKELKVKDYDRLLKMQARESASISSLSVKMRISQSTTINHRANKKAQAPRAPWEG